MEFTRLTSKGQMTLPVAIRRTLQLRQGDLLMVYVAGNEIHLKKAKGPAIPLSEDDPIWQMIGMGESGQADVSGRHDEYVHGQTLASG